MRRITNPSPDRKCLRCRNEIPTTKRADAAYCSVRCRNNVEKLRYKATHPEYVARQLECVNKIRHMKEYGHTRFLGNPLLNTKDRFRLARSLGFRSMLEYQVAKQLTDLGISFTYEKFVIHYKSPINAPTQADDD